MSEMELAGGQGGAASLFARVAALVEETRTSVAVHANAALTLMNWQIGRLIDVGVLQGKRGGHDQEIVASLAQQLTKRFYLRWLDRYERQEEGEEAPIGLILCTQASREQIELLEMHKDGIVVAEYWTALPPKAELQARIQEIYRAAPERVARREIEQGSSESEEAE